MKIDDCFEIGAIVKTHGFKGEVVLLLDVDNPLEYTKLESMFLEQSGKLIPFFIDQSQLHGDKLRLTLEDVTDEESAKKLIGAKAYLPLEFLPDLGDDHYYFHEIIGYEVLMDQKILGQVHEIYDTEPNLLFGFKMGAHEVLVPFQDQFLLKVDKKSKQIHVSLPEGYLDIYLENEA